jgi:hypothetical protein
MTMAIAPEPGVELERGGVQPQITIADDTALCSYELADGVRTEIWLVRAAGWELVGMHFTSR